MNIVKRTMAAILLAAVLAPVTGELSSEPTERVLRRVHKLISPARRAVASAGVITGDDGVPIVDYAGSLGRQSNPVSVSHAALAYFDSLQRRIPGTRLRFLNCADWLARQRINRGSYATLDYEFPWITYDLTPPWRSGMAQGLALEVMVRAHEITSDGQYLETASKLLNAFFIEVDNGGVTYKSAADGWWYEEYAQPGCRRSYVLNGMMFALLGIYDYYEYTGRTDLAAAILFDLGIEALSTVLPEYDRHGDSNYDRVGNLAGPKYHAIHIEQLDEMYRITNREIFRHYRDRWRNFQSRPLALRMILSPSRAGVAILGAHLLVLTVLFLLVLSVLTRRRRLLKSQI